MLQQMEQEAHQEAGDITLDHEQAPDKGSNASRSPSPDHVSTVANKATAQLSSESEPASGAADSSGEEGKPSDAVHHEPAAMPSTAPSMADLYYHGDLGTSTRLGSAGICFCLHHYKVGTGQLHDFIPQRQVFED